MAYDLGTDFDELFPLGSGRGGEVVDIEVVSQFVEILHRRAIGPFALAVHVLHQFCGCSPALLAICTSSRPRGANQGERM